MNDSFARLKQRVRDVFSRVPFIGLAGRARRALGGLHRNESGATMTEFVIVLPVFILVFNGVMVLGQFTRKGSEAPIRAYKKTFENVLPFQTNWWGQPAHMQTGAAAIDAGIQLAGDAQAHNLSTSVNIASNISEGAAYTGLGVRGHMGESYARTNALTVLPGTELSGCDSIGPAWPSDCTDLNDSSGISAITTTNGKLTSDLTDLTGDSDYAYALFNDGTDATAFTGGGGGILAMLNAVITAVGIRPAIAANVRYGTVYGKHQESYTFAGRTMNMDVYFSTLVPPTPKGAASDAAWAAGTTRTTMLGIDHYDDLLGIAWDQPLDSESISVPSYP
jgi:hypothetical protein